MKDLERKKIVQTVKKYFDIFVVLKSTMPKHNQPIEEYFSYGVHGLYFDTNIDFHSQDQIEVLVYATDLFARGWVFAKTQSEESMIKELLRLKIVPVLAEHDAKLVDFIKSHEYFDKISSNLIKAIPLLDLKQSAYSLTDRIKMKMLLESMNLRQKLMVKSVDESFGSSGL